MALRFLLDENISRKVASGVSAKQPEINIQSVFLWRDGNFCGRLDIELLRAVAEERLTLVTYDLKTIPTVLGELAAAGVSHGGVIFVDASTIGSDDFGTLIRSLIAFWKRFDTLDWTNRVHFLDNTPK